MKILISACLLGLDTKYNGKSNKNEVLIRSLKENHIEFFPLCSEQLGGLTTPREPSEIESGYTAKDILNGKGRVLTKTYTDVTKQYLRGVKNILNFCKKFNITHAILQERSPSCGYTKVYDGTFSDKLIPGVGILTQLLKDNDIKIIELEDFKKSILN